MSDPQNGDFVAVQFFRKNVQTSVLEGLDLNIFYSCCWAILRLRQARISAQHQASAARVPPGPKVQVRPEPGVVQGSELLSGPADRCVHTGTLSSSAGSGVGEGLAARPASRQSIPRYQRTVIQDCSLGQTPSHKLQENVNHELFTRWLSKVRVCLAMQIAPAARVQAGSSRAPPGWQSPGCLGCLGQQGKTRGADSP